MPPFYCWTSALRIAKRQSVSPRHIAPGIGQSRRRPSFGLFIDCNRIAQKFDIGAGTYVRDLNGRGFVSDQGGSMECHLGNRGGGGIDRLECDSLLFLGRDHDLAGHMFDAEYRGGRRAVLAVDDRELSNRTVRGRSPPPSCSGRG
jgi:hypothetical protein